MGLTLVIAGFLSAIWGLSDGQAWKIILGGIAIAVGFSTMGARSSARKNKSGNCPYCNGTGYKTRMVGGMMGGRPVGGPVKERCPHCNGTGSI